MPYRRSRLQDYYEELLGPDPSDEGSPAEPEPEESDSWLPSYIPPIEPATPSPGLTSGESDGDGRPAPPLDVDPAVQDYERNLYQRLGINRADQDRQSSDKADERAQQPPVSVSPPRRTVLPDIVDYEQGLYDRLGLIPPNPTKPQFPVVPIESPVDRIPEDIDMNEFLPLSGAETGAGPGHWQADTPLTQGQAMHVEHLLNVETDHLALEVLLTLQRDGLPPRGQWKEFMSSYALTGWDAESDAIAWATLAAIAHSDWDEWLAHADSAPVETTAQDLGNDWIEGLVIIDANSGQTLLERTGVVRGDGTQYVGLQDYEVEALQGLDLIFVHNHPNGSEASDEDLASAFAAGAELLIVITAQGQEFVYIRGRSGMVEVRDDKASYEVGPAAWDEAMYLLAESQAQARAFQDDAPELMFRQNNSGLQIAVTGEVQFGPTDVGVVLDEGRQRFRSYDESLFTIVGKSRLNHYVVLVIDEKGNQLWLDLKEESETTFDIIGAENLSRIPYAEESGAVVDEIMFDEDGGYYLNTVRETVDSLPIALRDMQGVKRFGVPGEGYDSTGGYHGGFDFFASQGTKVTALTDGEVVAVFVPDGAATDYSEVYGTGYRSSTSTSTDDEQDPETEGWIYDPQVTPVRARQVYADNWIVERGQRAYVIVRSGNAFIVYAHLDPNSIQVGTRVVAGQTIGEVGSDPEGEENDHLHLAVRTHGQNEALVDATGEYVADSWMFRPLTFINTLYLFDEDTRDFIIEEYDLPVLDKQELAITGAERVPHKVPWKNLTYYWKDQTRIR